MHPARRLTAAVSPDVPFEHFAAVDLRVGVVVAVDAFPEARRPAWKLTVDFGPALGMLRTSAQVTNYTSDALVGRRVVGAVNLGTKRVAGFASEFLVLGAVADDGTVTLLDVAGDVPAGTRVA